MVAFYKMSHLMDDHIFKAEGVLLGQFEVDPDTA